MKTFAASRFGAVIGIAGICVIAFSGAGRQGGSAGPVITAMVEVSGTHSGYLETSHLERITFQMPSGTTGSTTGTGGTAGTAGGTGATGGGGLLLASSPPTGPVPTE